MQAEHVSQTGVYRSKWHNMVRVEQDRYDI